MAGTDWSDEDLGDDEYPDEYEWDDEDDETELQTCPECGSDVYEDSVQCPVCGNYITFSTSPLSGRPAWWTVLGLCGIAAALFLLLTSALWGLWW